MQRFVSRRFCVYILPESHHRASPLSSGIIVIPIADSPLANDDSGKAVKMLFHKRNDACILYTNPSFYCNRECSVPTPSYAYLTKHTFCEYVAETLGLAWDGAVMMPLQV
jgi:hypothetical protein